MYKRGLLVLCLALSGCNDVAYTEQQAAAERQAAVERQRAVTECMRYNLDRVELMMQPHYDTLRNAGIYISQVQYPDRYKMQCTEDPGYIDPF